jgi:hypothetical protein
VREREREREGGREGGREEEREHLTFKSTQMHMAYRQPVFVDLETDLLRSKRDLLTKAYRQPFAQALVHQSSAGEEA